MPAPTGDVARPRRRRRSRMTLSVISILFALVVIAGAAAIALPMFTGGGSGSTPEELAVKVQANMQQLLPNNPEYRDVRLTGTLVLQKIDKQTYTGRVPAQRGDTPLILKVSVTYDGEGFMWHIVP